MMPVTTTLVVPITQLEPWPLLRVTYPITTEQYDELLAFVTALRGPLTAPRDENGWKPKETAP